MEDRTAEQLKAYDRKRARAIADMTRTEGWKYYEELLEGYIAERGQMLMQPLPLGEVNAVPQQEYLKGTMYGLNLSKDVASFIVAAMKQEVASETDSESEE